MNKILTLKVDRPAFGGRSIGMHRGKVIFIGGAIPGETVKIAVEEEKRDFSTASVREIMVPSPHRTVPECPYFGCCGGCQLQFMTYRAQVEMKEYVLRDCLKRLAGIEKDLSEALIRNRPWRYRLRGQFKVQKGNIGFFRARTRDLIDIETCPIMTDGVNTLLKKVRPLTEKHPITEIHITSHNGSMAFVRMSSGDLSQRDRSGIAQGFLESGCSGVTIESGDYSLSFHGESHLTFPLDNLIYSLSPMSFFQCNWNLNQAVVREIKHELSGRMIKTVLDLYAGAGNFSLPLADGREITAVEENAHAVQDGMRNVHMNRIKNYRFVKSPAEDFHIQNQPDALVVDPPRPGLTKRVTRNILNALPKSLVYVSCNPTTLARDMRKLLSRYSVESVRLIDFFPQTYHIESLTFLSLK